jgi:hypothetical protein
MISVSIVVLANDRSVRFKKCLHTQAIWFDKNVRHRWSFEQGPLLVLSIIITRRFGGFHDRFDFRGITTLTILPRKFTKTGSREREQPVVQHFIIFEECPPA